MAVTMTLGGLNLGSNFPLYSQTYEYIRPSDQGPAFKRVRITLSGFIEGDNFAEIMALYATLRNAVGLNDIASFTLIDGTTTIHNGQQVWVGGYGEPEDSEYGKNGVGDYSIELYYFEDQNDNLGINCSYGGYTFEKTPSWGRQFQPNREHYRNFQQGSTATVTLSGFLIAANHSALMAKIVALQDAFKEDRILTYGSFVQTVRTNGCTIQEDVIRNFAYYQCSLIYDTDDLVSKKRTIKISRIHQNPVITDQPFCDRRIIELMNQSGQTIQYTISMESSVSLQRTRELLAVEATNTIEPGGIEMQGGDETWSPDSYAVTLSVIKFHNTPVISNLAGT